MSIDRTVKENEWRKRLQDQTDPELIESFNREVGNSGSGYARSLYSRCLIDEISNRKRDFSVISEDGYCISYANKVILIGNKLVIDENQTKVPDTTNVRGIIYDPSEEDDAAGLKHKRDGYRAQEARVKKDATGIEDIEKLLLEVKRHFGSDKFVIYLSFSSPYNISTGLLTYLKKNYKVYDTPKNAKFQHPSVLLSFCAKYGTPLTSAHAEYPEIAIVKGPLFKKDGNDDWKIYTLKHGQYKR